MNLSPEKKWMPAVYQDKAVPPPRQSPSDWVKTLEDGTKMLEEAFPGENCGCPARPLADGEIVPFQWASKILTFEFRRDRLVPIFWPFVEGAETLAWQPGDADTVVNDPEQMAEMIENELIHFESVTIEFFCWSDDIPFIFKDGAFTPAGEQPN